jgi:hypothetical protein
MQNFKMSPYLINMILNDNFGNPDDTLDNTKIYVGLGIEFDEQKFAFSKEPVAPGFTILNTPVVFDTPVNGILRNKEALEWPIAEADWTNGNETIKYLGLYYNLGNCSEDAESGSGVESGITTIAEFSGTSENYRLIAVLPLAPAETVLMGERMVLNANSILIRLANR